MPKFAEFNTTLGNFTVELYTETMVIAFIPITLVMNFVAYQCL
jgi:hypothetical protein